ncbi:transcription factor EAT1 isoform X2 [Physcomitrium patens]|uniref:transcription factor EAT1 isoform X2 n=1 Tax=Physcomitrium patens TaxID=3218 RepID=UPI000D151E08|nr:transcription factor NAI1-like isoform X2 [Physcomitrium patens]|eukprot:XP_024375134.1 transcription factor NAI1-like isoform X2 [Physcomitrella patens]
MCNLRFSLFHCRLEANKVVFSEPKSLVRTYCQEAREADKVPPTVSINWKENTDPDFHTSYMAHNPRKLDMWNSYQVTGSAKSEEFDKCNGMPRTLSAGLQAAWEQLERTGLHDPLSVVHYERLDAIGTGTASRHDSGQVGEIQSGYNGIYFDEIPEALPSHHSDFTSINRNPSVTASQLNGASPDLDTEMNSEPEKKRGRRKFPEGWVASKNLISERKRREKLQKSLLDLRALVPKITKMDKVSILSDAIEHVQDLKQKVEMLENLSTTVEDGSIDQATAECSKSSGSNLEVSEADDEGHNQYHASEDASCSARCDYQSNSSSQDWAMHQAQLDVTKLEHGLYKLNFTCKQQPGVLVQLSQAIEAFVIEIVHTNIVVITPTKVTCSFVVKMSSWNVMAVTDVEADIKQLLGQSGLLFS